ncbi:MAG: CHAT domain-containing protein [Leptolyngbya sp. SIO1D8]|nr:CHAT domain-containing protein [Leptolyngbya sp. SIO1D8]
MPQFLRSLPASCRRWVSRWLWLVVLGCFSFSLSITVSTTSLAKAHWPPSNLPPLVAQSQADVWTLVASARALYKEGNYRAALPLWQEAATIFAHQGDRLNQAMAWSNLSLTYQALGNWEGAATAVSNALAWLETPTASHPLEASRVLAQSLDVRGKLAFVRGQTEAALKDWQQSQQLYAQLGHDEGYVNSLLNQAQAYQVIGQYLQAEHTLAQVNTQIEQFGEISLKISAGRSLANVQRLLGELANAQETLFTLLKLPAIPDEDLATLYNDWGNLQAAIAQRAQELGKRNTKISTPAYEALSAYKQAIALTEQSTLTVLHLQAHINALNVLIRFQTELKETAPLEGFSALITTLDRLLASNSLPTNRDTVYGRINYAESLLQLAASLGENSQAFYHQAAELLGQAVWLAEEHLQDPRTLAYAKGRLGSLYLQTHQLNEARALIEQAILIAARVNAPDIGYRWQRQLGKLLEVQAKEAEKVEKFSEAEALREDAIVAYRAALDTLSTVRSDLLTVNSEVQFSFRDEVEPVYREFIELLLKTVDEHTDLGQTRLREALRSFDNLQLAEINNFLGCDSGQKIQLEQVNDPNAATIYAMILDESIAVILNLPSSNVLEPHIISRELSFPGSELTVDVMDAISDLRTHLEASSYTSTALIKAEGLYNSLIQPLENTLMGEESKQSHGLKEPENRQDSRLTLVFVLDGDLRNIPMAILNDSQEFLIDKYDIVLTPRIDLFEPQPLKTDLQLLLGGTSEQPAVTDLPNLGAIQFLESELFGIQEKYQNSEILLNESFTQQNIRQELDNGNFSAVHFKTHGEFSSDPEGTFILGYGERISGRDLGNLIQSGSIRDIKTIDLLALSACKSAQGDNRAVLGLTGIAVRAGARTVVSSLWTVKDSVNTQFMLHFYQELKQQGTTRAEAFRTAQLKLIETGAKPYEWAPFVLVGNWQ